MLLSQPVASHSIRMAVFMAKKRAKSAKAACLFRLLRAEPFLSDLAFEPYRLIGGPLHL
jgi:hypothetical protein